MLQIQDERTQTEPHHLCTSQATRLVRQWPSDSPTAIRQPATTIRAAYQRHENSFHCCFCSCEWHRDYGTQLERARCRATARSVCHKQAEEEENTRWQVSSADHEHADSTSERERIRQAGRTINAHRHFETATDGAANFSQRRPIKVEQYVAIF